MFQSGHYANTNERSEMHYFKFINRVGVLPQYSVLLHVFKLHLLFGVYLKTGLIFHSIVVIKGIITKATLKVIRQHPLISFVLLIM